MIPPPLKSFIDKLKSSTDDGDVRWHEGAPQSYYCNHKNYSLYLNYHFNEDAELGSYYMTIKKADKESSFAVQDNEGDAWIMKNLLSSITVNSSEMDNIEDDFFD